jgi:hypothetical protein
VFPADLSLLEDPLAPELPLNRSRQARLADRLAPFAYGIGHDSAKVLQGWEQEIREAGGGMAAYTMKTSPEFEFMHGDPRYQDMLNRLDLME